MSQSLSRRRFLSTAAVTGAATLLPGGNPAVAVASAPPSTASTTVRPAGVALKAQPFPLTSVRLLPGDWKKMQEINRSWLYSLPNDRLAHTFRINAGIASDAEPLGGWEAPTGELRGHYIGHYLSACAMLYASSGDLPILAKANELVTMLAACQRADGYLSAYPDSFYERLREHKEVWAPFYTYHKILAGMIDMHEHGGNAQALQVATRMADWADEYSRTFTPEEWQKVLLTEQGGMNEASFNLYGITGNTKYRELAYRFEHKKIFDPLAANRDELAGNHTNTNIPKVIGAVRGYELTGDERYRQIAENFYRMVTEHHSYCTGGTSYDEFWQPADAIAARLGQSDEECCCSYNMMKLTRHLFAQHPDARLFDYYERLLFNVRAGTQDRNGMLMYYVALEPGLFKTFGTPFDAFWCCTGTGSEEYTKLNDSIYFHDEDSVWVNLFLASKLDWKERGLRLRMTTRLPKEERVTLTVEAATAAPVALRLRIPYWATEGVRLEVNGVAREIAAIPSSYVTVEQAWKAGDVITLDLPMTLHLATTPDDPQVQAAMYGPLVLAARLGSEGLTNTMIYSGAGPRGDQGYPMPAVDARDRDGKPLSPAEGDAWFKRVEGTAQYRLQFQTIGRGPVHTLVPLADVFDERYSVYLRNLAVPAGAAAQPA